MNHHLVLSKKNAPNKDDNIAILQSCLLPKMRLPVVLEGRFTGYKSTKIELHRIYFINKTLVNDDFKKNLI